MTVQLDHEGTAKDIFTSIMEQTDIACFNGSPTNWAAHQASLAKNGTIGWFYPNSLTNTLFTRISNGYYLWGSPFQVSMPWCFYYCPSGDFFDNLNGSLPVWAYAAPHPDKPGEMIPALLAEAYREGYDDLRYIATLDAAINAAAARDGSPAVTAARTLLASYTGSSSIPRTYSTPITQPTPEDLRLRRLAIVTVVEALQAGK